MHNELERMVLFQVLSWHSPTGTDQEHTVLQSA